MFHLLQICEEFLQEQMLSISQYGGWNVANVTNMREMFTNAKAFNQPIGSWNVSAVLDMYHLFRNANAFKSEYRRLELIISLKYGIIL